MKPGRELDALVAEAVLNWNYLMSNAWAPVPGHERAPRPAPEFSTDPRYARALAGVLEVRFNPVSISSHELDGRVIVIIDGPHGEVQASGETYAHALCLAALRVAEHDLKE